MRQVNNGIVLGAIRNAGPISRPDVARATGLSNPTVTKVAHGLLELGYITETESVDNGSRKSGPKPKLLMFNANAGYVIGVDTGSDNTIARLTNLSGDPLATKRVNHEPHPHRDEIIECIRSSISDILTDAGVDPQLLQALVLGTPGVVDPANGEITFAPQIRGWDGVNLAAETADLVPCPVAVENESNLSLLAEQWVGNAQECDNVLLIQFGIGIGGAFMLNGSLYRGTNGGAGEIAYIKILNNDDHPRPDDSPVGPFEWYAGGLAYRRYGAEAAQEAGGGLLLELAGGQAGNVTAQVVFAAARQGDPVAINIADRLLRRLGHGVSNIAATLDPERIIIGGGISRAGQLVQQTVQEVLDEIAPYTPQVIVSTLGDEGAVTGAVKRAIDIADERLFTFVGD